jgi:hypothetical protein
MVAEQGSKKRRMRVERGERTRSWREGEEEVVKARER